MSDEVIKKHNHFMLINLSAPYSVNNLLTLQKSWEILHILAHIDSHLFKIHLNQIREKSEVESETGVKKYSFRKIN